MIEIVVAAAVPAVAAWLLAARSGEYVRRAVRRWFVPAVLIWFAPCWITGGSPAGFDYLFDDVVPWQKADYSAGNGLLSDAVLQFVPWREAARESILRGAMPYLNRYAGSGSPLWENPQAAVAWPLTLAGLPFSSFAFPLFASVAKLLIALVGMYVFLRGRAVSHEGALAGAFAFGFSAFTIAFLLFPHTNVTVLLPWLLVTIDACARTARAAAAMAVVVALMILGGHPESVLHAAFVAIPFAGTVVMGSQERWRVAQRYLVAGIGGLALAAPLLIPFAAYLPHTERVARLAHEREVVAAPPATFNTLVPFVFGGHFVPAMYPEGTNFAEGATQYVGVAALALAVLGALAGWRRPFWIVVFFAAAFFAFSSPPADAIVSRIPIVDISMNGRLRFLCAFAAAVLAAQGVDAVRAHRGRFAAIAGTAALLIVAIVALSWGGYGGFSDRVAMHAAAAVAAALAAMVAAWRQVLFWMPVAVFADLAVLLMPYHPPVGRDAFYPRTPAVAFLQSQAGPVRFAGLGWTLLPNSGVMLRLEDVGVHDPVGFAPYLDLLESGGYDRRIYHNFFNQVPAPGLLSLLGVRYLVAPPGVPAPNAVYRGADAVVIELPGARRVAGGAGTSVESVRYAPNRVRVAVRAERDSTVDVAEVALPGWSITRNGEPWPLETSDVPLLRWRVPPGRSEFELRYRPVGLMAGTGVALLAAMLLASYAWRDGVRRT